MMVFDTQARQYFVAVLFRSRLQAVPFWLVERVRSQRSETGAWSNKREEDSARSLQFSRARLSLDYPERDCLQFSLEGETELR